MTSENDSTDAVPETAAVDQQLIVPKHSLVEAKRLRVCRVCGEPDSPRQVTPVSIDTFVLDYGAEYAHSSCIGKPLMQVWAGFPSLVVDYVDDDGAIHVKPPVEVDTN